MMKLFSLLGELSSFFVLPSIAVENAIVTRSQEDKLYLPDFKASWKTNIKF